jgi:hypothetical protein
VGKATLDMKQFNDMLCTQAALDVHELKICQSKVTFLLSALL